MEINIATQADIAALVQRLDKQEKELTTLRRMVTENGEMVSTTRATELTGISDTRTLKKYIKGWTQEGTGPIKWPKTAILEYLEKKAIAA